MQLIPSKVPSDYHEKIRILHVINRPLEEMTVSEICKNCDISRKKFYSYFSSKYAITHWYLDFCFSASLYEIGRSLTWHEAILLCLQLVEQERTFFVSDYQNLLQKNPTYYWPLKEKRKAIILETIRDYRKTERTPLLLLEIELYSQLIPDLIRFWLIPNEFSSIEEYAQAWEECIPRTLYESLELQ